MSYRAVIARSASVTAVLIAATGGAATAQTGGERNARDFDSIVVTAQKREQSLQDVPVAVTAFDAAAIEIQRIDELQDYLLKTPNVGFVETGNRSRTQIGIRGVTNLGGDVNTTGIYIDEFNVAPSSSTRTFDVNLFDVERIEVLRGPQGTFFGRNTLGGALNITTKKPSLDGFSGSFVAEYGSYDHRLFRSSLNAPITDKAAIRVTGYYAANDGFIENTGPSGRGNDQKDFGVRVALRAAPTDNWTADFGASYINYKQGANNTVQNGRFLFNQFVGYVDNINAAILTTPLPLPLLPVNEAGFSPDNIDTISTDFEPNSENETYIFTLRNIFEFGEHTLTSVTGYIDSYYFEAFDGDQSSFSLVESSLRTDLTSFSQELRVNGPIGRGLYTLGFLYADDERESASLQTIMNDNAYFGLFALGGVTEGPFTIVAPVNTTETIAVFGQIEWPLTDTLTASVGGRFTRDKVGNSDVSFGQTFGTVVLDRVEDTFSDFSSSFVLSYQPTDDVTAYASVKRAYKPGGTSATASGPDSFNEETAWSYELGLKTVTFGGRLRTNAALFYIDWTDLQVSARDPLTLASRILNAAEAENYGFELEATALLTDDITFDAGFGYLEAEFGSFPEAVTETGQDIDASGNRIQFTPKYSINLGLQYDFALGGDKGGYIRAEYTYKADQFGDVENTVPGGNIVNGLTGAYELTNRFVPAYSLVNLRAGLNITEAVNVSVSVENLLNEDYITGGRASSITLAGNLDAVGTPRTIIGRVGLEF